MPDMMSRGMAWLASRQRAHLARPVVYERADPDGGAARAVAAMAVLGRTGATGEGTVAPIRVDTTDLDFIIPAADLTLDGRTFEPRVDDRILLRVDGTIRVYEIMPLGSDPRYGGSRTPWQWSDPQHTLMRIHARLTDEYPHMEEPP